MKSRAILWLLLSAALFCAGCTTNNDSDIPNGPVGEGTKIHGDLKGIITDYGTSPFWVDSTVTVQENDALIIPAGTEIRFGEEAVHSFIVKGQVIAEGTPENNITFTSMAGFQGSGDYGQWRSIIVDNAAREAQGDTSIFSYCMVKYGASSDTNYYYPVDSTNNPACKPFAAFYIWQCSPKIINCTIAENGYHALRIMGSGSDPLLLNNNLYHNDGDGIRFEPEATGVRRIYYTNSYLNSGQAFGFCPTGTGVYLTTNTNRDSCDYQNNLRMDPLFIHTDTSTQDPHDSLDACSPCIGGGYPEAGGLINVGSLRYNVAPNEIRRLVLPNQDLSGALYRVTCSAFVEENNYLKFHNTKVVFEGLYEIRVYGLFQAENTTFIPLDSTNDVAHWKGIVFESTADPTSFITRSRFVKSTTEYIEEEPYGGTITIMGMSPDSITHNTFENSLYAAISCLYSAQPLIAYNHITGFGTVAINCYDNSHPDINHNIIHDGVGYGINCGFNSRPVIESNLIYNTASIGIRCDNQCAPTITYNTLAYHWLNGVECLLQSNPLIQNNIVAYNHHTWDNLTYFGTGIQVEGASLPTVSYNDVFQVNGQAAVGFTLDTLTNITANPQFVNAAAGNFHLLGGSPADTASTTGGPVGAYGVDANWTAP
jgi:hypothetical protein